MNLPERNVTEKVDVRKAQKKFMILVGIFLILLAVSLYLHAQGFQINNWRHLKEIPYSGAAFVILYVLVSFLPIPGSIPMFAAGLLYPTYLAMIYSLIGSILFVDCLFLIVRYLGKDYIEYITKNSKVYHRFEKHFEENAFINIVMLRFFFIIPVEVLGVIGGLSNVKFRTFFAATTVGSIPLILFTVMLIKSTLTDNNLGLIISIFALLAMLVVPFFVVPGIRSHRPDKKGK
jgi:uncharacterized membrane protein YdjX (TVP38/TMEM64 family)